MRANVGEDVPKQLTHLLRREVSLIRVGEGVPAHNSDSSNLGLFLYMAPGAATWK